MITPTQNSSSINAIQPRNRPCFLITIDTEGDDLWANPRQVTTRNALFLPRFQALCEAYGLKPTYLTNYEMARDERFQEFAREVIAQDTAEIGMHLHAWDSPPEYALTEDDLRHHPYLIEYPDSVMRAKIAVMTDLLEQTFSVKMVSHRAGRWAFDARYAAMLIEQGYLVDCSVTPFVSWQDSKGDPKKSGGADYSGFPETAYFLDPTNVRAQGSSALLEVPVTIQPRPLPFAKSLRRRYYRLPRLSKSFYSRVYPLHWLRPNGRNRAEMVGLLEAAHAEGRDYVEFMLHSSEFMPAGSPNFKTQQDIERLYADLEHLFAAASEQYMGATLREYYHRVAVSGALPISRLPEQLLTTEMRSGKQ